MTSSQLCKVLKIEKSCFQEWLIKGYIAASYHTGNRADFTHRNVVQIATFKKMLEMGFSRKVASEITQAWPITTSFDLQLKSFITHVNTIDWEQK